jgi:hypothetical protein
MSSLTTASGKGAPLTPAEADGNFFELDRRTGVGWFDNESKLYLRNSEFSADFQPFIGRIPGMRFVATEMREGFVDYHVRHEWKPGTMMYPHVHFGVQAQASGTVRWGFEYIWARRNGSTIGNAKFSEPVTIYLEQALTATDDLTHIVVEAPEGQGIPGDSIEVDAMILCRLFRDAEHPNDTFAHDVFAFNVDLHTETDRMATPLRVSPFYAE